jgi:hypothetical protein
VAAGFVVVDEAVDVLWCRWWVVDDVDAVEEPEEDVGAELTAEEASEAEELAGVTP